MSGDIKNTENILENFCRSLDDKPDINLFMRLPISSRNFFIETCRIVIKHKSSSEKQKEMCDKILDMYEKFEIYSKFRRFLKKKNVDIDKDWKVVVSKDKDNERMIVIQVLNPSKNNILKQINATHLSNQSMYCVKPYPLLTGKPFPKPDQTNEFRMAKIKLFLDENDMKTQEIKIYANSIGIIVPRDEIEKAIQLFSSKAMKIGNEIIIEKEFIDSLSVKGKITIQKGKDKRKVVQEKKLDIPPLSDEEEKSEDESEIKQIKQVLKENGINTERDIVITVDGNDVILSGLATVKYKIQIRTNLKGKWNGKQKHWKLNKKFLFKKNADIIVESDTKTTAIIKHKQKLTISEYKLVNDFLLSNGITIFGKDISIEKYGKSILISGEGTKTYKNKLIENKGKWNGKLKAWVFPMSKFEIGMEKKEKEPEEMKEPKTKKTKKMKEPEEPEEKKPLIQKRINKKPKAKKDKVQRQGKKSFEKNNQKHEEATTDTPLYIFYDSLYKQKPESKMAIKWLTEYGAYEETEREELEEKYSNLD